MYQVSVQTLPEPAFGLQKEDLATKCENIWELGIEKSETKSQKSLVCHYHNGWCCLDPGAEDEELT